MSEPASAYQLVCKHCDAAGANVSVDAYRETVRCLKCGNNGKGHLWPERFHIVKNETTPRGESFVMRPYTRFEFPEAKKMKESVVGKAMKHTKSKYPSSERGQRIRALRLYLNVTQAEFGRPFKVTNTAVSDWERKGCVDAHVSAIAKQFGCSEMWLMDGEGPMFAESVTNAERASLAGAGLLEGTVKAAEPAPASKPTGPTTAKKIGLPARAALPVRVKQAIEALPIPNHNGDRPPDPRDQGIYLPGLITSGYDRITITLERAQRVQQNG